MTKDLSKYQLLTPEETANYLGVKVQTLAAWRTSKKYNLPYVKIGKIIRYQQYLVNKWLAENTKYKPGVSKDFEAYGLTIDDNEV